MDREDDRTFEEHAASDHDARLGVEEAPMTAETDTGPAESPGHDVPFRPGPDLVLDERLTSAAAPFLYLLAVVLIAVTGYFVYLFLQR